MPCKLMQTADPSRYSARQRRRVPALGLRRGHEAGRAAHQGRPRPRSRVHRTRPVGPPRQRRRRDGPAREPPRRLRARPRRVLPGSRRPHGRRRRRHDVRVRPHGEGERQPRHRPRPWQRHARPRRPVKGGKVYGKWPGLERDQLWEGRDLAITTDFRDVFSGSRHAPSRRPQLLADLPGLHYKQKLGFVRDAPAVAPWIRQLRPTPDSCLL